VKVYKTKSKIAKAIKNLKQQQNTIGMVPTMGALHQGHLQLVIRALKENNKVVVSIFVNPTQFDKSEDLEKYPRTPENDITLLKSISESNIIVYTPIKEDIYDGNIISESFSFDGLEFEMEGKFRHGHFDGVGTIVKRFFEIIKPDKAYFGEKDFQQLQIIKKLVNNYNIPVKVIGCIIHREPSGLAMSSRNARLEPKYKKEAPFIFKTLQISKKKFKTNSAKKVKHWVEKHFKNNTLLELEYFLIADTETLKPVIRKSKKKKYRAFIAAYAGGVRLIDNIALN